MRRRSAGFTLVELMIVVAIIGVLSSLAIYGIARYLKTAKTAEATRSLGALENGSRQQFGRETPWPPGSTNADRYEHVFCPDAPKTPSAVPVATKIAVPNAAWTTEGWTCLKFVINDPQYYSYSYKSNSQTGTTAQYTATAQGDLDGNGTTSLYELMGRGNSYGDSIRTNFRVVQGSE